MINKKMFYKKYWLKNIFNKFLILENYLFWKYFSYILEKQYDSNYKYFELTDEIKKWGQNHSNYFDNLNFKKSNLTATKNEIEELEFFDFYMGRYHEPINRYLRKDDIYIHYEKSLLKRIQKLDSYIEKFSIKENIVVSRTVSNVFTKKYIKGYKFIDYGFLSTSLFIYL